MPHARPQSIRRLVCALMGLALLLQWTAVPLHLASHDHVVDGASHDHVGHGGSHHHVEHGASHARVASDRHEGVRQDHLDPSEDHEPHALEDHLLSLTRPPADLDGGVSLGLPGLRSSVSTAVPVVLGMSLATVEDPPRPPPLDGRRPSRAPPRIV